MKKLHKILTLALALIMILGIMAVPVSAVTGPYERLYVVWTEDELRDLSIPRPENEGGYIEIHVVPKNKDSNGLRTMIYETYETRVKYIGKAVCVILDSSYYNPNGKFNDEVIKAAREAYDRNTDAAWKEAIAEAFYLDTKNSPDNTPTEPEQPTTVTPPVTTPTTTVKVDSFSDVKPGDWYYEAVMALANSGILAGYSDGTFRPNSTITAGELATIICRIFGVDLSVPMYSNGLLRNNNHFGHSDKTVNPNHWAENAINYCCYYTGNNYKWRVCVANMELNRGWAISQLDGAITSAAWPDGTKLSCTAQEQKAMLDKIPDVADGSILNFRLTNTEMEDASHYADYRLRTTAEFSALTTGEEVIAHDYMCVADKNCSTDCDLAAWNAGLIAEAYSIGLVNGVDSTGRCDPWAPVTRAQVVQMLYNIGITSVGQLTPTDWDELRKGLSFVFGIG